MKKPDTIETDNEKTILGKYIDEDLAIEYLQFKKRG